MRRLLPVLLVVFGLAAPAVPAQAAEMCMGLAATITGTAGADNFEGVATPGQDVIVGLAGDDVFLGLQGDDVFCGGDGSDVVYHYDVDWSGAGYAVDFDMVAGTSTIQRVGAAGPETDRLESIEQIYGSRGNDRLLGTDERNWLDGYYGDDYVDGRGGHDILNGGGENDEMYGGPGNDSMAGQSGVDSLNGGDGVDRLEGLQGDDILVGGAGFDYADYACTTAAGDFCRQMKDATTAGGFSGQRVDLDTGVAKPVDDTKQHQGTDQIVGVEGVQGSPLGDVLLGRQLHAASDGFGGYYGDYFWPGLGDDTVHGRGQTTPDGAVSSDYVDYSLFVDDPAGTCSGDTSLAGITLTLATSAGAPEVTGYQGEDELISIESAIGSARRDTLNGNGVRNELWGGCGDDQINGAGGNDVIAGDEGHDIVRGQNGDDRLAGGAGDDAIDGGAGSDLVSYDAIITNGTAGVEVHLGGGTALGEGEDALAALEVVLGSDYDDVLVGAGRRDVLIGGAGSDELWGREGADVLLGNGTPPRSEGGMQDGVDVLIGGPGLDTADYSRAAAGVTVDLRTQTGAEGGEVDHLAGIDAVHGTPFADVLRGDAVTNRLFGGAGDDRLFGRGGNDYLDGEDGKDRLDAGGGTFDVVDFGYGDARRVVADVGAQTARVTESTGVKADDVLIAAEIVAGTRGNDVLKGSAVGDFLAGDAGEDLLRGLGGHDELFGGGGTDDIGGGAGRDTCYGSGAESPGCESVSSGTPGWYARVSQVRQFRNTGADDLLDSLDEIIEDLRRLHRRRLHR